MMNTTNSITPEKLPLPDLADQFLLRRDIAFLNHGSFGACPRPVFETYQRWQQELEAQPVDFLGRRLRDLLAEARACLADYVGTGADNLVFVSNATHGINIVSRALNLEPGDEVLATDHEYGAAERAWRFACQKRRVRYVAQPISLPIQDAETVVEQLWAGVTERTRVIFLSHITSPTALILPVRQICQRARAAGIITVIDGAHAPGQVDLALDELGVDFYSGNCHKWLCAPKGSAFLYARTERQPLLDPLIVSWGWQSAYPGPSPFIDHFQWLGTDDPAAFLSVPAAIEFQNKHDWPQVRAACHRLAQEARNEIQALSGLPHLCPDSEEWWMQMCTVLLPACDPKEVGRRLWEEFQVEVPVSERWGQPAIRLSIQAYNRPEDIERLLEGLKQILADF
jgi:isopenicillin-N epimerase